MLPCVNTVCEDCYRVCLIHTETSGSRQGWLAKNSLDALTGIANRCYFDVQLKADEALYDAKKAGRNRMVSAA